MTALASTLQRMWSAKDRLPRLTGRGEPELSTPGGSAVWLADSLFELIQLAKRAAPTVVVIALRIFR